MKLMLVRDSFSSGSTAGVLFVDSRPFCNTLEPTVSIGKKVTYGKGCCVPPGIYSIDFHYSPKFGKYMLTLCGVRGRSGILIHSGNTSNDTSGCILVGQRENISVLSNSRSTLDKLFNCCLEVISREPITIIIKNK